MRFQKKKEFLFESIFLNVKKRNKVIEKIFSYYLNVKRKISIYDSNDLKSKKKFILIF